MFQCHQLLKHGRKPREFALGPTSGTTEREGYGSVLDHNFGAISSFQFLNHHLVPNKMPMDEHVPESEGGFDPSGAYTVNDLSSSKRWGCLFESHWQNLARFVEHMIESGASSSKWKNTLQQFCYKGYRRSLMAKGTLMFDALD